MTTLICIMALIVAAIVTVTITFCSLRLTNRVMYCRDCKMWYWMPTDPPRCEDGTPMCPECHKPMS